MKKQFTLRTALVATALCCGYGAMAQQTGSFNQTITFMGSNRLLSCYVPPAYDPNTPTRLIIGLHGLGDVASAYRNALVNSLGFATAVPNTILVCPDGGNDPLSDFYAPVGDEAVIEEAINFARANYNIDTTQIVLQGFSLGGRSALRYGLQHTNEFKGLLLTTPALQGVKEALTPFANGGLFDYDQAPQIPIYITHGNTDVLYQAPIDSLCEQLVRHNAAFKLYRFNGGHTVPALAQIQDFNTFFEQPVASGEDVSVARVLVNGRSCNTSVPAKVLVQNTGTTTLTDIGLSYEWNGTPQHYTWTGSLASKQHTEIALPAFTTTEGSYTLEVMADTLNTNIPDPVAANNANAADFRINTTPTALPYTQQFSNENYENTWLTKPSGDYIIPWSWDEDFEALFCVNSIYIFDNRGQKEEILSPVMNLSSLPSPFVAFDVSFNYSAFTASFFGVDTAFSDTLEVLVSTDCGETYQSVYKKAGAALATYAQPLINPANLDAYFVTPADSNWRREKIDLSAYASSTDAVVKFSYTSGLGGSILLDNVAFTDHETGINELPEVQASIYPNPVQDQCRIVCGDEKISAVTIYDISGKKINTITGNNRNEMLIPTNQLSNGVYLLHINTDGGEAHKKIIVQR
jgi:enterochelin esterase-like enzyme